MVHPWENKPPGKINPRAKTHRTQKAPTKQVLPRKQDKVILSPEYRRWLEEKANNSGKK